MPSPEVSFDGVGSLDDVAPPDPNGDVGPAHYVQWVNLSFAIWDKGGHLLYGPAPGNTLFTGFGGPCEERNAGDPIVQYDHLADRWMLSQFTGSGSPYYQCVAVSQTPDPTGPYYRYAFLVSEDKFNDYPKFGVWPDAYYMAINEFGSGEQGAVAFEREKMLLGLPASLVSFHYEFTDLVFAMLPSDLDGPPPPPGAPNYFVNREDPYRLGYPWRLSIWEFHVDWDDPMSSTFGGPDGRPNQSVLTAPFDSSFCLGSDRSACIPQPDTGTALETISDRLMYRLQYRNFGTYEALIVNHTVDVDVRDHAGIRWQELRKSGVDPWSLRQEGTHAPDGDHRWMGSIAMDRFGNVALGYSVSGPTLYPSIRYAGRLATDPLGTLPRSEATLVAGGGSQLYIERWGDYSMMAVDPVDDCTFWFTGEYYTVSGWKWSTRIGSFRFPGCPGPPSGSLRGTVTDSATGAPLVGARVTASGVHTLTTRTGEGGSYALELPAGAYSLTAAAVGYAAPDPVTISVADGSIIERDLALAPLPSTTVQGVVTDGSGGGWPLYAHIDIRSGQQALSVFTNPQTGQYSVPLKLGTTYTFTVTAVSGGYEGMSRTVTPEPGGISEDFAPVVDQLCSAPGYRFTYSESFDNDGVPPGWTVVDHLGNGQVWRFDDPGGRGNSTPGTGGFAVVDSDFYGPAGRQDTSLVSPSFDLSAVSSVPLLFASDFRTYSGGLDEVADVDVSDDGGQSWTNVWRRTASVSESLEAVDITALTAGKADVRLRFHYYDATWEYWWQVDDVRLGVCERLADGLVVGNVYARDGAGVVGASVSAGARATAETFATPDDPALNDGFFVLGLSAGEAEATASFPSCPNPVAEVAHVSLGAGRVVSKDFHLNADLGATPFEEVSTYGFAAPDAFGTASWDASGHSKTGIVSVEASATEDVPVGFVEGSVTGFAVPRSDAEAVARVSRSFGASAGQRTVTVTLNVCRADAQVATSGISGVTAAPAAVVYVEAFIAFQRCGQSSCSETYEEGTYANLRRDLACAPDQGCSAGPVFDLAAEITVPEDGRILVRVALLTEVSARGSSSASTEATAQVGRISIA
jgi:hypothetical protein